MRVLDIDLDFFLNDCCPLAEKGQRPPLLGCEPWDKAVVRSFLEHQCGLSVDHPIPGRIFETHDQALVFWAEMIAAKRLQAPFHVTHVDAHSDLGIGYPGPNYVLFNVLSMPVEQRRKLPVFYEQHKLDEANYLLFALATRWVVSLDNVRNPRSRADIPQVLLDADGNIRLCSVASRLFESKNGTEPVIPFSNYPDYQAFSSPEPYDFVTLAMSPRYAPEEADCLRDIIGAYIAEEPSSDGQKDT
jgi:hypothetical protein